MAKTLSGAGTDTPTPVFTHVVTNANTCFGGYAALLDNPFLNNNPTAIVFFQANFGGAFMVADYTGSGFSDCPAGRWYVGIQVNGTSAAWTVGLSFAVLVIDP
jgi:hypothetical protein